MTAHLALVLPGRAYGPHGPAIHLPCLALRQHGAEVRAVAYPDGDDDAAFHRAVADQVGAAVEATGAERVTFVAKSLGTVALAGLDPATPLPHAIDAVWVTPIFRLDAVRAGAVQRGWRSLLIAGDADGEHVPAHHETVRAALGAESLVLAGAGHTLEVEGDVAATLERWAQVAEAVLAFAGPDRSLSQGPV